MQNLRVNFYPNPPVYSGTKHCSWTEWHYKLVYMQAYTTYTIHCMHTNMNIQYTHVHTWLCTCMHTQHIHRRTQTNTHTMCTLTDTPCVCMLILCAFCNSSHSGESDKWLGICKDIFQQFPAIEGNIMTFVIFYRTLTKNSAQYLQVSGTISIVNYMYATRLTVGDVDIKYSILVKNSIVPVSLYWHYMLLFASESWSH